MLIQKWVSNRLDAPAFHPITIVIATTHHERAFGNLNHLPTIIPMNVLYIENPARQGPPDGLASVVMERAS